jgi:dipeptidyl aminopeptidase/acylaminoacyl peptidase
MNKVNTISNRIVLGAIACVGMTAAHAEPPSLAAFANGPDIASPAISPDGRFLSIVTDVDGKRIAMVRDLTQTKGYVPVLFAKDGANVVVSWCQWGNKGRLVCGLRGLANMNGFVSYAAKLMAVDPDGGNVKELSAKFNGDTVIDWTPGDPDHILVSANNGVGKVNINTGDYSVHNDELREERQASLVQTFYSDSDGNFYFAHGKFRDTRIYYSRKPGEKEWHRLTKTVGSVDGEAELRPIRVDAQRRRAYAMGLHNGKNALWEIDLDDKEAPQMLLDHPQVDLQVPFYMNNTFSGVRYYLDRPYMHYLDDGIAELVRGVNRVLPNAFNQIESASDDRKTLVIASVGDTVPRTFYLFNADSRKLVLIGKSYPDLDSTKIGSTRLLEYKAQDGTVIPAYLTTPPNVRAEKLPLIVQVHGQYEIPQVSGFNPITQMLASRGYAVLQMSFRGSPGYGEAWEDAAKSDWGSFPYSDSLDAARWAISAGIADPKRICILGQNYGAYTALISAVNNGDTYKCAATIDGRADMFELAKSTVSGTVKKTARDKANDPDPDKLKREAPVSHVEKINIPLLVVHRTFTNSKQTNESIEDFVKALRREKKTYTEVKLNLDNYTLPSKEEKVQLYSALEKFFVEQLGPGKIAN